MLTLGFTLSRSIWEMRLAETPICDVTSRRVRPTLLALCSQSGVDVRGLVLGLWSSDASLDLGGDGVGAWVCARPREAGTVGDRMVGRGDPPGIVEVLSQLRSRPRLASTSPAERPPVSGPPSTSAQAVRLGHRGRGRCPSSRGRIVRRSMTSASIPFAASCSAAARFSCTPRIAETTVTSPPCAGDGGLAESTRLCRSPRPPSVYRRLYSTKITGLSSSIDARRSAFASPGVEGATHLASWGFPSATPRASASGWRRSEPPAPTTERMDDGDAHSLAASGTSTWDIWLTSPSMTSVKEAPNMTRPLTAQNSTAEPNAAPASASSEMGVSKTRSAPYFSRRPGVTAKTPPASATSSPKPTTRSSAAKRFVERLTLTAERKSSSSPSEALGSAGCSSRDSEGAAAKRRAVGAVDDAVVGAERRLKKKKHPPSLGCRSIPPTARIAACGGSTIAVKEWTPATCAGLRR